MKVLHLSFHRGCQNDMEYICDKLGYNLTFMEFNDGETKTNAKYNIGHERALKCWNLNKDYFYKFDVVITSDTAPLSRVFLQNNFKKKLIIWICNRFDYYDAASLDCDFPDKEYYDLIRDAKNRPNVIIAGYTPFENYYANNIRNVYIGNLIIKPIGKTSITYNNFTETIVENKQNKFIVPPYHNENILMNLSEKLNELNISNYSGRYNGPLDLQKFKGVIHIPYAWSNLALFEAIQLGVIYFIPSLNFLIKLSKTGNFWFQPPFDNDLLIYSEWYCKENKDIFNYFDSWEDLVYKVNNLNYNEFKLKLLKFGKDHEDKYLNMWKNIFKI
jgi:hypothetical protein